MAIFTIRILLVYYHYGIAHLPIRDWEANMLLGNSQFALEGWATLELFWYPSTSLIGTLDHLNRWHLLLDLGGVTPLALALFRGTTHKLAVVIDLADFVDHRLPEVDSPSVA